MAATSRLRMPLMALTLVLASVITAQAGEPGLPLDETDRTMASHLVANTVSSHPDAGSVPAQPATAALPPTPPEPTQGTQFGPAPPWRNVMAPGDTNGFALRCETPNGGAAFNYFAQDLVVYGCPIRIYDATYQFGSPDIAVNPKDSRQAAFFTLHAGPEEDGSTDQSRRGSTHTTFITPDRGISWNDEPVDGGPTGASLGDYSSGTMDSDGNLYIAYGWHDSVGGDQWDGSIGLFKAGQTTERGTVLRAYEDPYYILAREVGNPIRAMQINYVADPAVDEQEQFADANETQEPSDEEDFGEEAIEINRTDHVVVSWHEKAVDWRNASTGLSGWIDFAWSSTDGIQHWNRLDADDVIGPCFDASNSVVWNGDVYVACVVDKGYKARTRARVGDIDIWKFDPAENRTSYVGTTGLNGPNPRLAAAPDGAMAAITVKVEDVQQVSVEAAFGWYGRQWSAMGANLGPTLHGYAGGLDIRSAHVTGVALTEDQHTLYLVYKEWNDNDGGPALPDPSELSGDPPRLHDYRKVLVAANACQILQAAALELGQGIDAASYSAYMSHPALFNDIQDGMQYVREPNGEELVYFAINDYGAMQFGAIQEASVGQACANFPVPLPSIPAPPVPQALTTALPGTYGVGAAVGVGSLAMVGYLLAARRRAPTLAAAEDR